MKNTCETCKATKNPLPYFGEPVRVRDWDVIDAVVSAAAIPVENGGEVRKIAI